LFPWHRRVHDAPGPVRHPAGISTHILKTSRERRPPPAKRCVASLGGCRSIEPGELTMHESAVFMSAALQSCRMLVLFALLACFSCPATAAMQPHPNESLWPIAASFREESGPDPRRVAKWTWRRRHDARLGGERTYAAIARRARVRWHTQNLYRDLHVRGRAG
jgi:hypothetical protein